MAEKEEMNGVGGSVADGVNLAEFNRIKAELRRHTVANMVKAVGKNKVIWRQTMVWRRVDPAVVVPDDDLVAYSIIHALRKTGDPNQKIQVSDNEIEAYKALDPDFNQTVTLADVQKKVKELKFSGTLSVKGDNAGNDDDGHEE
ncbi:hypothetical protein [Geomonas agri]|uniref:hypothetical protein n=1 Tax=Geomonas agri TaxID=2873702 RepID=UPI001CD3E320|nr:hypothetical protein [Geomonas agri]